MAKPADICRTYIPLALLASVIIAGGYVQGRWTDRWSDVPVADVLAEQLDNVPMDIGGWRGEDGEEPSQRILDQAGASGSLTRVYQNARGDSAHIFIVCGRMRDVIGHTPDGCYPASGFDMVGEPEQQSVQISGREPAVFFTTTFVKSDPTGSQRLRVYWTWCGSDGWKAPRDARSEFAGDRAIYKLYVVTPTDESDKGGATERPNPATGFIPVLIPELERVFEPAISAL